MLKVFKYHIHRPFYKLGLRYIIIAYILFIAYSIFTPLYGTGLDITEPSLLAAFGFSSLYILFAGLIVSVIASVLFAYIEIGRHNQQITFLTEKRKLFEVLLPEGAFEGAPSLQSMQKVFNSIALPFGETHWFPVWWKGKARPTHSFEIVSKGGIVSFTINISEKFESAMWTSVLSFFPDAQMREVDDYVYDVDYDEKHKVSAIEWNFKEGDGAQINSYADLQRVAIGEEAIINPLAPLYDLLSSIRGDEQIWVQYVFRTENYAVADEKYADNPMTRGFWDKKKLSDRIREKAIELHEKSVEEKEDVGLPVVPESDVQVKDAASRQLERQVFEVGIRMIYIASEESFSVAHSGLMGAVFKETRTQQNSLRSQTNDIDDLFPNISGLSSVIESRRLDKEAEKKLRFQLYRDRLFWFGPALYAYKPSDSKIIRKKLRKPSRKRPTITMTSETLATVCHFPMTKNAAPSVLRGMSNVLQPPDDIPT